jgi:electron transport complex protein RnfG
VKNNFKAIWQQSWLKAALLLALFTALAVFLLSWTQLLTRTRIADNVQQVLLAQLKTVFPAPEGILQKRPFVLPPTALLGQKTPSTAYFVIKDKEFHGVILEAIAPNGYNGAIRLLLGIDRNGVLQGVRVLSHQETPGLGDPIEERKSDWIYSFTGKSLENTRFAVKKDGGDFAAFTGATITPRAVVGAVKAALEYFALEKVNLEQMFLAQQEVEKNGN